jgi:oxalate decarboxylase/phosphoglucose isomerase-like protein (cupin superfamily)
MTGKVGKEYFMTKGHFHMRPDRAEFYRGVRGEGMLIMMDRNRENNYDLTGKSPYNTKPQIT